MTYNANFFTALKEGLLYPAAHQKLVKAPVVRLIENGKRVSFALQSRREDSDWETRQIGLTLRNVPPLLTLAIRMQPKKAWRVVDRDLKQYGNVVYYPGGEVFPDPQPALIPATAEAPLGLSVPDKGTIDAGHDQHASAAGSPSDDTGSSGSRAQA